MDEASRPLYALVSKYVAPDQYEGGCVRWCGPMRVRTNERRPKVPSDTRLEPAKPRAPTKSLSIPCLLFKRRRYAVRRLIGIKHGLCDALDNARFSMTCQNNWCVAPAHMRLHTLGPPLPRVNHRNTINDEDSTTCTHSMRTEETDEEESRYAALSPYPSYDGTEDDSIHSGAADHYEYGQYLIHRDPAHGSGSS